MTTHGNLPVTAATLAAVRMLQAVPLDVRERLAQSLNARRFPRGTVIIKQHETRNDVFFVISGQVRVTYFAESGQEVLFRDIAAGEIIGELSALDGQPRSAEVAAQSDAVLVCLRREQFIEMLHGYPEVAVELLRHLAANVRALTARVVEFSTLGVKTRVDIELLRLARASALAQGGAALIAEKHDDIAKKVSTTREAVTREIAELARLQIVEKSPRKGGPLRVPDLEKLEQRIRSSLGELPDLQQSSVGTTL